MIFVDGGRIPDSGSRCEALTINKAKERYETSDDQDYKRKHERMTCINFPGLLLK